MSATFNFARRPFRDDRPAYALAGFLALAGAVLLTINLRLAGDYRRQVADTRTEIAALEAREHNAEEKAQSARSALGSYQLSALAEESRGLARIVAERKFSWTALLARLERTLPPDVGLVHLQPQFDAAGASSLELQLMGRSRDAIVRTLEALAKNPAFTHVELRTEAQPEVAAAAEPIQFQISSRYEPGASTPKAAERESGARKPGKAR